ncbi:hypothetical protein [Streptomyces flavofungini]|uniref:hypothetical protein n=1 Tax=Streptomyces flavofungini TaxID=68200 RepID=UPI0025B11F9A|nr:hypothetical protein [Streptomyces flavofungini]WJV49891.1 hypothetical protein QUY26_32840 [Streptomyces flavofungini]
MRPTEFCEIAADLLKNSPDVQGVQTLTEVGDTKHPYGLAITVAGREQRWQFIGQLADGAKHDIPTPAVLAQPAPFKTSPVEGAPDAWLAGVIGAAESPELKSIEVWSIREGAHPDQVGCTLRWHNGEQTYLRKI